MKNSLVISFLVAQNDFIILLVNLFCILLTQRLEFEWLLREHVPKVLAQLGSILQVLLFLTSYCNWII